jgi:hypothetical protein
MVLTAYFAVRFGSLVKLALASIASNPAFVTFA